MTTLVTPVLISHTRFARAATFLGVLALASCQPNPGYTINKPADQAQIVCSDPAGISCNVPVEVQWVGASVRPHPEATLDGAPLTAPFSNNAANNASVATITTGVGAHTLVVSGDLTGNNTLATYSATSMFTVTPPAPVTPPAGGFSISANPNALVVERGNSATTTITVTRSAPFTGPVTLTVMALPTGVTTTAATIAAGATSAVLTLSASPSAAIGKVTLNIRGTSGTITANTNVALTIGREPGVFQEANPNPYLSTLPSTRNALAGTFRVDIAVGPPTVPEPRKATFFRGTQRVGNEIGFTLGPVTNLGGAGFCNNSSTLAIARGVVLSGQLPGYADQNVVTFLDLTVNSPTLAQATTNANVQQTTGGPFILFQPRVFFSRDCTLALVAGANKLGPSKHILRVYDLTTGQPIGSEVPFDTPTFSALVRNAAGKQEIEVKVDTGSATAQTVVIPIS